MQQIKTEGVGASSLFYFYFEYVVYYHLLFMSKFSGREHVTVEKLTLTETCKGYFLITTKIFGSTPRPSKKNGGPKIKRRTNIGYPSS